MRLRPIEAVRHPRSELVVNFPLVLAILCMTATCTPEKRPLSLDDLPRLRQPRNVLLSPDGRWVAYVVGDSLWIAPARHASGDRIAPRSVATGMANQANFDRPFGAWSPNGESFVFRRGKAGLFEQGVVTLLRRQSDELVPILPDSLTNRLQTFLHWAAGPPAWSPDSRRLAFLAADTVVDASHLQLWVVDFDQGEVARWASDTGGPLGGVSSVAWSPDGRWVAYSTGAFRGDGGRIVLLDAARGSESTPVVLVEGNAPMYRDLSWSPDRRYLAATAGTLNAEEVVFRIEDGQDGAPRAELIRSGHSLGHVAGWLDNEVFGQSPAGMSASLALVDPTTGSVTPLTGPDTLFTAVGVANLSTGPLIAYTAEAGDLPRGIWTANLSEDRTLTSRQEVTAGNPWLDSVMVATARVIRWTSQDDDTLEAQVFLPHDVHVQRAPHVPLVIMAYGGYRNEFPSGDYFLTAGVELLASAGFAVARPNTRDAMASEFLGVGAYGSLELQDTEALVDELAASGLIDPDRVAVMGHSHGGAMAYYYLTHSQRFCAVIPINGWSDWSEISSRLRVPKEELSEKLRDASPILNAEGVNAPLLAVSGAEDTQVLPHNAIGMVDTLRAHGKSAELLHFPDEGHLIERPANVRMFWNAVLEFLNRNCSGGDDGR